MYYVEIVNSKENERLPIQKDEWDIEYIGEHIFEQNTVVYKIVLEGGVLHENTTIVYYNSLL